MEVSGISNAEILATFFDNFLTKDYSEKIGDEDIEDALRKVHIFLFSAILTTSYGNFNFFICY